ncbi:membrane-associated protein, putative [Bodo saltans]|uniref:Membrane-associated protein, putative n=1 Tax=Bodo saltans TaxID=75058 RepID=A0A0S4JJH8_BODSA|nr:membrane-associated protein, putative [Bodo saltans]|eukprot:CUG88616.1 membrane-associated protein, putative [Bodo saltans]
MVSFLDKRPDVPLDADPISLSTDMSSDDNNPLGMYVAIALCVAAILWWFLNRGTATMEPQGLRIEETVAPVDRDKGLQQARERLIQQSTQDLERVRMLDRRRKAMLLANIRAEEAEREGPTVFEGLGRVLGHGSSQASPYQPDDIESRQRYRPYTSSDANPGD